MHQFTQHFNRDVDAIFEGAEGGGLAAFERAASFYGIETDGLADPIEMRRARRRINDRRNFGEIVAGQPTTARFSAKSATIDASDMQDLLVGAGAPNIAALRDDLWGPIGTREAAKIARQLGFPTVKTVGIAFGTLPNGKRGARGVRVEPPGFLRALINAQPGIGATGADVKQPTDLVRVPAAQIRPVLIALGSDISATGGPDAKFERLFRSQVQQQGCGTLTSYTAVGNDVVVGPRSAVECLIKKAANALKCASVSSQLVNGALMLLGHRDRGITLPADRTKPNTKLTAATIKRFKQEARKHGCTVRKIESKKIPLGRDPKIAVICPPECVGKVGTAAGIAAKAAAAKAAAAKKIKFSKRISTKELQKLLMQCSSRARKTLKNDKEVRQGKFGRDTREELNRVLGKLGFKKVFVKTTTGGTKIKISPPEALTALRKCAADGEKERARKRRKAARKKKDADDLVKPESAPMEPEEPAIEPDEDVIVVPDTADDPFDNNIEPIDLPSPDEEPARAQIGVGVSLLAGLAGIALVLLASQGRTPKKK